MQEKLNIENDKDVQGLNIWYNTKILKHNRPFLNTSYIEKGIVFINDLLDEHGKILDFQSFKNRYNSETNFLNYLSLVNAVKAFLCSFKNSNKTTFNSSKRPKLC